MTHLSVPKNTPKLYDTEHARDPMVTIAFINPPKRVPGASAAWNRIGGEAQ